MGELGICEDSAAPGALRDIAREEPYVPDAKEDENASPIQEGEEKEEKEENEENEDKEENEEKEQSEDEEKPDSDSEKTPGNDDTVIPKIMVQIAKEDNEDDGDGDDKEVEERSERKKPVEGGFDPLRLYSFLDDGGNDGTGTTQQPLEFCDPTERMDCQNGGTCMKTKKNSLTCSCVSGFTGIFCQFSK